LKAIFNANGTVKMDWDSVHKREARHDYHASGADANLLFQAVRELSLRVAVLEGGSFGALNRLEAANLKFLKDSNQIFKGSS
jgi:hypothetical protein